MKTTSSVANSRPQSFTQYASLVAISLAAAVLVSTQRVFAQTDDGFGPEMSIEHRGSPMASDPVAPWDVTPPSSLTDPALAPAPKESREPPMPQMHGGFMPGRVGSLTEPWADPAIPATSPMLVSPPSSMVRPGGGLFSPAR
jgi:hypothetical protein